MESKKINQLATELTPALSDLTIIGDPTTGISKKITLSQMASLFTGTVEEYPNLASFPLVGTADTIYIALDTNIIYRWNTGTSAYVELSPNIVTSLVFSDANGFDGTISLVGSTATLTITTALTQGSVPFIGTSGALSQDNANLFFDDTNNRLGINTNTPTTALDVFGSGIIGRLNGTSTNNSFLGFASAGTNQWSIGNVQSDHRFRIYSEANAAELVSVLQTGEFGIGIANPLTKLHIFGGASALIANLDANTSVAKSISFRSGNSSRINLEVSGTESGSNAGMDFYLRAYTDAGALLSTPLTISRSTGAVTLSSSLTATGATLTSTQTNLVLNTTTNTSFTKLSFQENGSEKATITYPNSTFGAPTRREKLEISNLGGINFITQNAPLTPNMSITSTGNIGIGTITPTFLLHLNKAGNNGLFVSNTSANTGGYLYAGGLNGFEIQSVDSANSASKNLILQPYGGNVGIGTSTVTALLTVAGTTDLAWSASTSKLQISRSGTVARLQNYDNGSVANIGLQFDGGFVGIQTSSPTCPLHILNLQSSGGTPTLGTIGTGTSAYFCNNNSNYGMLMGSLPTGNSWIQVARTDNQAVAYNLILQPLGGSVTVTGSLSKGSGSFKIDHPLESMSETHHLVHSFVESPQANNIYRGKVQLKNGIAEVNLDEVSTMTEGTFAALNREIHTYTSNETDWDAVRGKVEGNILYIECQNNKSNAIVSWLVIGERKDKHIMDTDWTDENGKVIVEPLKPNEEEIELLKTE